jgi:hypothetical protein
MAKAVEAYRDERGNLHDNAVNAVLSDLAAALGRVGDEGGLTPGVARLVLEKRIDIEKAFSDLDYLSGKRDGRDGVLSPEVAVLKKLA